SEPAARYLRVQLWLLQDYTWKPEPDAALDPIVHEDVRGTAWFDDVVITRLPRAQLMFSEASGIAILPERGTLVLKVQNPTDSTLTAKTVLRNASGEAVAQFTGTVAQHSILDTRYPVPVLAQGAYTSDTEVFNDGAFLLRRSTRFTLLNASPKADDGFDFGVDLGQVSVTNNEGLAEALHALGATTAKISIPFLDAKIDPLGLEWIDGVAHLANQLASRGIDCCAVALPPPDSGMGSMKQFLRQVRNPEDYFGPVLAHLGGVFATWQLDHERNAGRDLTHWTADDIARFRGELTKVISLPRLIHPLSIFDAPDAGPLLESIFSENPAPNGEATLAILPSGTDLNSLWIPPRVPASGLPWQLACLVSDVTGNEPYANSEALPQRRHWASFGLEEVADRGAEDYLADLAQRIILARTMGVRNAVFPAPLAPVLESGSGHWAPTPEYPVMRTLFHALRGKHATAVLTLPNQTTGILFRGESGSTLAIWSWNAGTTTPVNGLYLGDAPRLRDLWSNVHSIPVTRGVAEIPVSFVPVLVENVDGPLLQMQKNLALKPRRIAPQDRTPTLFVSLQNPYDDPISGTMEIVGPTDWLIRPQQIPITQGAGETVERPFGMLIPPNEMNDQLRITIKLSLFSPVQRELMFEFPIEIALENIDINVIPLQRDGNLVLQIHLRNAGPTAVSYSCFCQPPGMRRQDGAFLDVQPLETRKLEFIIPNAEFFFDHDVVVGFSEVNGNQQIFRRVRLSPGPID
ncbi:MAG: hypothetical protein AB7N71_08485, partial [Phycisphaerae bacterium]